MGDFQKTNLKIAMETWLLGTISKPTESISRGIWTIVVFKATRQTSSTIATQGPRPNTVVDFWRMIWQEQVSVVAMLANVIENGKKKCEQYWPELGKEETYGAVTILTADVSVFADFTFRHFNISCKSKKRKVM
ncbi:unnamed protein product [Timema podura]|uniref:Tyrosine-protein phosphatase domain-containing protein n=1 Tax=Timema podura TaxID=61482 RepID=A0ABN7NZ01_TIMPD|nr:unnamed protein product [Timema podura]